MTEGTAERRFALNIPRGLLIGVLVVVVLYFVWLLLIAGRVVVIRRGQNFIDPVVWVWVGLGVFGIALLIGLLALLPGKRQDEPEAESLAAIPAADARYAPPPAEPVEEAVPASAWAAPTAARAPRGDVELKATPEDHKGKQVLEVSLPPKSAHRGAVYAKAYVPVDERYVLRVEDLVAERGDVA